MKTLNGEIVEYIGDGVYACYDGFGITLRINDFDNPTDVAYLEEAVFQALVKFHKQVTEPEP